MDKFEGKWMRNEDIEDIQKNKQEDIKKLKAAQDAQAARFKKPDQEREVAERPAKLMKLELALCTNDPKHRDGALETLGQEVKKSLDPEFGIQAVEILANLRDSGAVSGLSLAGGSQWPEVRRQAYEALVWRSTVKDDQTLADLALHVMTDALKIEKDEPTAKAGIEALAETRSKPALAALVAALATPDAVVRGDIIRGLNDATKQNMATREEWEKWWQANGK